MSLDVVDYRRAYLMGQPPATSGGPVTLQLPVQQCPAVGQLMRITGIAVVCPTSQQCSAYLYDSDPTIGGAVPMDGTQSANFDINDDPELIVPGGSLVYIVFNPVDAGVIARARLQWELVVVGAGTRPQLAS